MLRAGDKSPNIPTNSILYRNRQQREFYVCGITNEAVNIKYTDTGEYGSITWFQSRDYMPFCEGYLINSEIKKR